MTEVEWLACAEPMTLFESIPGKVSLRKARLLACACTRRLWVDLANEARISLETAERFADRQAGRQELRDARGPNYSGVRADNCASLAAYPSQGFRRQVRGVLVQAVISANADSDGWVRRTSLEVDAAGKAVQIILIHDIFGNPYRPTPFDRTLRVPVVVSLARAAYDERLLPSGELDLARLAVLSDALEDAGCTDAATLEHLRSPGPHVRGCWALDLILGKS